MPRSGSRVRAPSVALKQTPEIPEETQVSVSFYLISIGGRTGIIEKMISVFNMNVIAVRCTAMLYCEYWKNADSKRGRVRWPYSMGIADGEEKSAYRVSDKTDQ